jgi:hypothetical protein
MRVDDRHARGRGAARARARLPPIKGGANASNACRVCDTCRVYAAGAGVCPRAVCSGAARTLPAGHVGRKRGRAAVRGETGHALFGQVKVRQRRWVAAHNAIKRGSSTRVSAGARGGLVRTERRHVLFIVTGHSIQRSMRQDGEPRCTTHTESTDRRQASTAAGGVLSRGRPASVRGSLSLRGALVRGIAQLEAGSEGLSVVQGVVCNRRKAR